MEGDKNDIQYFHKNYLDHVYAVSDDNGNIIEQYRYSAFGEVEIYNSVGVLIPITLIDNDIMWNVKRYDGGSGLYMYLYRHYDPSHGRWPSRDPIEERGGVNLYAFVWNQTLAKNDYLGFSGGDYEFYPNVTGNRHEYDANGVKSSFVIKNCKEKDEAKIREAAMNVHYAAVQGSQLAKLSAIKELANKWFRHGSGRELSDRQIKKLSKQFNRLAQAFDRKATKQEIRISCNYCCPWDVHGYTKRPRKEGRLFSRKTIIEEIVVCPNHSKKILDVTEWAEVIYEKTDYEHIIMHELSHAYLGTVDTAYYFDGGWRTPGLRTRGAGDLVNGDFDVHIQNADTYGMFGSEATDILTVPDSWE